MLALTFGGMSSADAAPELKGGGQPGIVGAMAAAPDHPGGALAPVGNTGSADAVSEPEAGVQPNIVGGTPPTQDYPGGALVSLKYDAPDYGIRGHHTCGATLVGPGKIATNAHCVTDPPPGFGPEVRKWFFADPVAVPTKAKQFWVRVGSHYLNFGGETARATVAWVDPRWAWGNGDPVADAAVLLLDHPLRAQTVALGGGPAQPGALIYGLGWGLTNPDGTGDPARRVREFKATVVDRTSCAMAGISTREICVDNPNGVGPCFGDSGGPVLVKDEASTSGTHGKPSFRLVGSASRSATEVCGADRSVYTSLPEYRSEIYAVGGGGAPTPPRATKPPASTGPVPVAA